MLTTHQLAMAEDLADRVAVIRDGRIITDLPTSELLARYVEDRFEVLVAGSADAVTGALPVDAALESADGHTTIQLPTSDQDALHGVLSGLRDGAVPLVGVSRVRPGLEDIFVKLVRGEG